LKAESEFGENPDRFGTRVTLSHQTANAAVRPDLIEHALRKIDAIRPDGRTIRQFDWDLMLKLSWKLSLVDMKLCVIVSKASARRRESGMSEDTNWYT